MVWNSMTGDKMQKKYFWKGVMCDREILGLESETSNLVPALQT